MSNVIIDTSLLDGLIVGRVEPHIYAFSTETVPNYLKVGDTYRPVSERLKEWGHYFPNLKQRYEHSAMLESGKIFRDFAVHQYLELEKNLYRLQPNDLEEGIYYSKEFFKNATPKDIDDAIVDIKHSEESADGRYHLYTSDYLPAKITYKRDQNFEPRENQQAAIDSFKTAISNGRNNLLMYAVMRFGKSFTAMCCATEMDAPFVLVVSAKADVRQEWKKTVESHVRFKEYIFLDGEELARNHNAVSEVLKNGEKVVLFLTLQDLQGQEIKSKHEEIFKTGIDLLIVDETHFGARAEEYGRVLRGAGLTSTEREKEIKDADTSDDVEKEIKALQSRVRLHLSGTPYRILMGDEFSDDDIIAFCQYSDIAEAQEKWNHEHCTEDNVNEWENPYYGFPQMIRFAFSPNKSSVQRMEEMKRDGITYAFSALFKPKSLIKNRQGLHKQFEYEKEILDLLETIDGTRKDENLLGFLDYDKLKDGAMCRHMVCVLPYKASCDALEALIERNAYRFKNLSQYKIINIAGVDNERMYADNELVKHAIKECEAKGQKTLTLTVNRMLTGSTVEEWDTMLYFKDTASPQEYDQAIFRIQNQYVKTFKDHEGNFVRQNMKPQTLLVDFDPNRMFRMQEMKSQFYNVNTDKNGNAKLCERIARELVISPIISLNHGLLQRVEAADIMKVVREYSQNKSILDEAADIPCDYTLLDNGDFRSEIESLNPIDAAGGLEIKPNEGDNPSDYEIPESEPEKSPSPKKDNDEPRENDKEEDISKKIAAYYSRILFYAFLTESQVTNLEDIISSIIKDTRNNHRIAKVLGLKVPTLHLIQTKCNPFILSKLDYKIQNINSLMNDARLTPLQRALHALKKFARISDSEVVTPTLFAEEMVSLLPEGMVTDGSNILDIAAVQGEFACAIYQTYGHSVADKVLAIPTSPLTRELTKKVYCLLGLKADHVLNICTTDLVDETKAQTVQRVLPNSVDVVIGVPPMGERRGGGRNDGRSATYQNYFFFARDVISPRAIVMMTQSTWYSGGRGERLDEFRDYMLDSNRIQEIHDYPDVEPYIQGVTTLRGGICMFLWNREYEGDALVVNKFCHKEYALSRPMRYRHNDFEADFFIRWNMGLQILDRVLAQETNFLPSNGLMYHRNPFRFPDTADNFGKRKTSTARIKVYLAKGNIGYTRNVKENPDDLLGKWKVLVAKASSGGDTLPHLVISEPIVAEPNSVTANSHYAILPCSGTTTKKQAENLKGYLLTRFCRFMVMLLRSNQNMRVDMYQFAPRLDFNRAWTDDQLYARYNIAPEEQEFIEQVVKERPRT